MGKKLTDQQRAERFLSDFGITYTRYRNKRLICEMAQNFGAVVALTIGHHFYFNFNKSGEFVGHNTSSIDSFVVKRRKYARLK